MLAPLTSTPRSRRPLSYDGLNELEGLRLAQRLQGDLCERQVASQVGQLGGKLWVQRQPFTAHGAQQQRPAVMAPPIVAQVTQQVEGGAIHPAQVIQQQQQRRALRQGVQQARYRFKQPELGRQFILRGGRQIGVAHQQPRQQARELGQPHVGAQVLRAVFLLHPPPHSLPHRPPCQAPPP